MSGRWSADPCHAGLGWQGCRAAGLLRTSVPHGSPLEDTRKEDVDRYTSHVFFPCTLHVCSHHIVAQGVSRVSFHPHVIHDVVCLSVCCLFVSLSPVSLPLLPLLFHILPVLCLALHLQCRHHRGLKPLHSRRWRSIAPWRYTILSQVRKEEEEEGGRRKEEGGGRREEGGGGGAQKAAMLQSDLNAVLSSPRAHGLLAQRDQDEDKRRRKKKRKKKRKKLPRTYSSRLRHAARAVEFVISDSVHRQCVGHSCCATETGIRSATVLPWRSSLQSSIIAWAVCLVVNYAVGPRFSGHPRSVRCGAVLGHGCSCPLLGNDWFSWSRLCWKVLNSWGSSWD